MTVTPRQLSDAIKADYDEILAGRTEESHGIERWATVRTITACIALGVVTSMLITLLTAFAEPVLAFFVFVPLFFAATTLLIPAFIVWAAASLTAARLEAQRREVMFTEYGIVVDRTLTPHVYSVANLSRSGLEPELRRTRALLAEDEPVLDVSDTEPAVAAA